ncbi:fimbria/pilus outer membrane usher protein [Herbaspirillum frisingense]|uniref:fimbria/pilus outer membrane usher protein n=1 Tax=Herbaspirillum frisingense TaxID=92645 RepID=UPI0016010B94|nr:fimbria/pilus outer membrane usher protein [Herbaspirillum frisingense]QNB06091.1 fimbria/pilus outer membrane usher protein [Herbaspirillum frisingense]
MKISKMALALSLVGILSSAYAGQAYQFDGAMLDQVDQGVDISLFNQGLQQPGTYRLDVLINGERVDHADITFRVVEDAHGKAQLSPVLSLQQLTSWGVMTSKYPALAAADGNVDLKAIAQAKAVLDLPGQQLLLSIPQVALRPRFHGLAPQNLWDDGITAFLMNYTAGTSQGVNPGGDAATSSWVQLQPGFNAGAWRIRNAMSWSKGAGSAGKWQSAYLYAKRPLYSLKSALTLGQSTSSGEVFDGLPFTGAMMESDDAMVPYSQREFAPAIIGVAHSQARVEVRQNGYLIYTTTVAAGPFSLRDVSVGSSGGDIEVTVWEADGSKQVFTVPYQTPAIALHQGYLKYSATVGHYRPSNASVIKASFVQATLMYGLPWNLTAYGGMEAASHYHALSLGLGKSLGEFGALSLDGTMATGQQANASTQRGSTWRLRYSNTLPWSDTYLSLASWQYASAGYHSLSEVLDSYHEDGTPAATQREGQRRARTALTLSQSMGNFGNLNLSATRTDWRDGHDSDMAYALGWSRRIGTASLSLNWSKYRSRTYDGQERSDNELSVWLSIPLGHDVQANWHGFTQDGKQQQQLGLNGQAFDRQLNWNLQQDYRPHQAGQNTSTAHLGWRGRYGQFNGDYSYSQNMRQAGVNVAGGMVIQRHGLTLSQPLSDTVALVEAPGASAVAVDATPGARTDWRGYTAVSAGSPYQTSTISLDPLTLPDDAEVVRTDTQVVPTEGAVVEAKFGVRVGARALMNLRQADGKAVPFGAQVSVMELPDRSGIVGSDGQLYLSGLPDKGVLNVKWGDQQCRMPFTLSETNVMAGLHQLSGVCQQAGKKERK